MKAKLFVRYLGEAEPQIYEVDEIDFTNQTVFFYLDNTTHAGIETTFDNVEFILKSSDDGIEIEP